MADQFEDLNGRLIFVSYFGGKDVGRVVQMHVTPEEWESVRDEPVVCDGRQFVSAASAFYSKPGTIEWPNTDKIILSLCDLTGTWSQPYADAGYTVVRLDIQRDASEDIRLFEYAGKVHGVIAQPPCTQFAGSGARWWKQKAIDNPDYLTDALALVDACMRIIMVTQPQWWVLENPVGRLKNWIGPHVMTYQPFEYAMHADDPDNESYTKRTCLWGNFAIPEKAVHPLGSSIHEGKMHKLPPSADRANLRSATPQGFARAFFKANP